MSIRHKTQTEGTFVISGAIFSVENDGSLTPCPDATQIALLLATGVFEDTEASKPAPKTTKRSRGKR